MLNRLPERRRAIDLPIAASTVFSFVALSVAFRPVVLGCSCVTSLSVCDDVRASNLVFIGAVEKIDDAKSFLSSARTPEELRSLLEKYLYQEDQITLKIKAMFRQADDDDADNNKDAGDKDKDAKDDDQAEKKYKVGDSVVVWTESGECGYRFEVGETYLVYAVEDEGNGRFETTKCTRTARVTDAGEDLAYLFFYQNGGAASARVEGFATSDVKQLNQDRFHYSPKVGSPVTGISVEIRSERGAHFAEPDLNGHFVFDGLAEGLYQLFAYSADDATRQAALTSSIPLRIRPRSCNSRVLFIPRGVP